MVAETTSGCCLSADTAISRTREEETAGLEDEKKEPMPPAEVGVQIASVLLAEIEQGGVVDSTHQVCDLMHCTSSIQAEFSSHLYEKNMNLEHVT